MPVYENSLYCKAINIQKFYKKIQDDDLIIKACTGCGREGIIKPFKLIKNTFEKSYRDNYIKIFIESAYNEENGLYIVCIQHNNENGCYCFGYERVSLDPPEPRPHFFTKTELFKLFGIGDEPDYQPEM